MSLLSGVFTVAWPDLFFRASFHLSPLTIAIAISLIQTKTSLTLQVQDYNPPLSPTPSSPVTPPILTCNILTRDSQHPYPWHPPPRPPPPLHSHPHPSHPHPHHFHPSPPSPSHSSPFTTLTLSESKIRNLKWSAIFPILHEFDWPCVQVNASCWNFVWPF